MRRTQLAASGKYQEIIPTIVRQVNEPTFFIHRQRRRRRSPSSHRGAAAAE
jgi:hypothetical protein